MDTDEKTKITSSCFSLRLRLCVRFIHHFFSRISLCLCVSSEASGENQNRLMEFTYIAINPNGAKVTSQLAADTEDAAVKQLQKQGFVILNLMQGAAATAQKKGRSAKVASDEFVPEGQSPKKKTAKRIKSDDVTQLSRELAIMIESGVSIIEAIDSLGTHNDNLAIQQMMMQLKGRLHEGVGLGDAMAQFPKLFSTMYVSMIRTAEVGGRLAETLNQAAEYQEASQEMKRKVKGAMAYPVVLLVVTSIVLIFMLTFVIPQFSQLFTRMNAKLPIQTAILMSASVFLKERWYLIPIVGLSGFFGGRAFLKTETGRRTLTLLSLKFPGIKDIVVKVAVARILRALGTLLESGVSLLVALEMAAQSVSNYHFERAMKVIVQSVSEGKPLTQAMRETGVFPPMICQMISVGEKSGKLSSVLLRMAKFYEAEVDARLKMLSSILEPVMIVVIGIMVGGMAVSIIGPIYSLTDAVK